MNEVEHSVHEPVLGTRLALTVTASTRSVAHRAEVAALAACDRLEATLSVFRPDSAWVRWKTGVLEETPPDVAELLRVAHDWHRRSDGAFNPNIGRLRARWQQAAEDGVPPSREELAELARASEHLPYRVETDGSITRTDECAFLDLHALAKGWVADRAAAAVMAVEGVAAAVVNLGGDLVHAGTNAVTVGVEDPRRPFDNAPPLARARLARADLATGSGARRPIAVGTRAYSHVLDPRTGWPATDVLSATAIGRTAAEADALATIAGVLSPARSLVLIDQVPGAAVLLLDHSGLEWVSGGWPAC